MTDEITIYQKKMKELKNPLVLVCFPTMGVVSSIAANFIATTLKLKRIGGMDATAFQPAAVVHDGVPLPPVRIYGGKRVYKGERICSSFIVVMSEFVPPAPLVKPLAAKILDWAKDKGAPVVVSLESMPVKEEPLNTIGVTSTDNMKQLLKDYEVSTMENGVVGGLSGVLLYLAEHSSQDMFCLISEAHQEYPDARAAAHLIQALSTLLPELRVDAEPLLQQAELIEAEVRQVKERAEELAPGASSISPSDVMFR